MDDLAVDGNAIGGRLMEVFGTEMTTATGTCGSCGAVRQVAELVVYRPELGTVVRCRSCTAVLMVFVEIRGITCVDLEGLAGLSASLRRRVPPPYQPGNLRHLPHNRPARIR